MSAKLSLTTCLPTNLTMSATVSPGSTAGKADRGILDVDTNECKGCGLCVEACPTHVIAMSAQLNHNGFQTATYAGQGCAGCGVCFMVCPEPGALTVYKLAPASMAIAASAMGGAA